MVHTDVINIVSANPRKFEEVYDDFQNLEASCEMVADSSSAELEKNVYVMINSLLKFKTSKFELLADSISNKRNSRLDASIKSENLDATSAKSEID